MKKPSVPDEELKKIAEDLFAGRIFSNLQCRNPESEVPMVFLPIALATAKQLKKWKIDELWFLYEYMDKAMPRSINGMPIFGSFHGLKEADAKKMLEYHEKIKTAVEEVR